MLLHEDMRVYTFGNTRKLLIIDIYGLLKDIRLYTLWNKILLPTFVRMHTISTCFL